MCEKELPTSRLSKVIVITDIQRYRQTDATEIIYHKNAICNDFNARSIATYNEDIDWSVMLKNVISHMACLHNMVRQAYKIVNFSMNSLFITTDSMKIW